ncbi:MAG TPA: dihydroorotase family protein [Candidatus Deferrimicrobium sp.]|nr:dihydroorotase family protein [Candidatus Deferrimicrobium sp.]
MDIFIKNCEKVYTPEGFKALNIIIEEGKIREFTSELVSEAYDRIIDASNKLIIPGIIDLHVHFYEGRETWFSGTSAAAGGGVTSVFEQPFSDPPTLYPQALNIKIKRATKEALIDFGFHGGATPINIDEIDDLAKSGVKTFKIFLPETSYDFPAPEDDDSFLDLLHAIKKAESIALIHAENRTAIKLGQQKALENGKIQPKDFPAARPPMAEIEAVSRTLMLADLAECPVYFVHLSTGTAGEIISTVKNKQRVYAETCPQYLLFDESVFVEKGPYARVIPPMRPKAEVKKLWGCLSSGIIDVIATDHCAYPKIEKERGWHNIFLANNGIPGLETSLPLMLTQVHQNRLDLERLIHLMSVNPAKIMGIYPKKGCIQPGSDADLTLIDFNQKTKITIDELHTKSEFTLYEGLEVQGVPEMTISRGKVVMENGYPGEIISKYKGQGEFLKIQEV